MFIRCKQVKKLALLDLSVSSLNLDGTMMTLHKDVDLKKLGWNSTKPYKGTINR